MTCVASVCTALSSASRKVTAMTLPRRACVLPSSSREPTHDCCAQNSRRSCPLVHRETPLFGPPLIVSRLRSTAAAMRKNSSPENLTQLHYLRVPSSSQSVSLRFRDLYGQLIALPCAQGVAQQFLNFLPLPQGQ